MKVIGLIRSGLYIAEISQEEIEKVMGKYYATPRFSELKIGSVIDLDDGYNYRSDIQSVCRSMTESMKSFEKAQDTLLRFSNMIAEISPVGRLTKDE